MLVDDSTETYYHYYRKGIKLDTFALYSIVQSNKGTCNQSMVFLYAGM